MEAGANAGTSLSKGRLDPRLSQLARLYGIQTSYVDARKQRVDAHPESILQVLQVLGAPLGDPADAGRVLEQERREQQVEPVFVAWDGQFRAPKLPKGSKAVLELASGENVAWPPRSPLPNGYHRLHVTRAGKTSSSLVISSPQRACFPTDNPQWGVFAPLYALHSKRSPHTGDLTDLKALAEWTHNQNGRVVSTLPLLAAFLDRPFEPSPYSPVSRLFWNELYIDPVRVPEFATLASAQRSLQSPQPPRKRSSLVDYRLAMQEKRKVLEMLAREFFLNGSEERRRAFRQFVESDPQVTTYAQFRARTEHAGKGWQEWTSGLPEWERSSEELHLYVQWIVQDQLQELSSNMSAAGSLLYLDLPLGLHRDAFDTWRFPGLFAKGVSGGAPPDPVFTAGQNWAFQPLHPRALRADGYRYVIAVLRNHLRYARLLRIDHVMGLHRLFWIPEGSSGERGVYVEYPAEEMYAVLCLESHRAQAGIVGENLGVVPPEVNRAMNRHSIRQLYVAQYETVLDGSAGGEDKTPRIRTRTGGHRPPLQTSAPLRRPPRGSVASLNTHDLFPFQAFLDGSDIDTRLQLKLLKPKDASIERKQRARVRRMLRRFAGNDPLQGCLDFLAASPASVVLVNLEDLWNETAAQNVPSTTTEHPNWRRRMRYSMERLLKNAHVAARGSRPLSVQRRNSPSSS